MARLVVTGPATDGLPLSVVQVYVEGGATRGPPGIAHLTEHLHFRRKDVFRKCYEFAGQANAWTGLDAVCYHVSLPHDRVEEGIRFLIQDVLLGSAVDRVTASEIESESRTVLTEQRMRNGDPAAWLFRRAFKTTFGGATAFDDVADAHRFSPAEVADYHARTYIPSAMTVVLCSPLPRHFLAKAVATSVADLVKHAKRRAPREREREREREVALAREVASARRLSTSGVRYRDFPRVTDSPENANLLVNWCTGEYYSDYCRQVRGTRRIARVLALELLAFVLGGSLCSELFQKLRTEMNMVYRVSAYTSPGKTRSLFSVSTNCLAVHVDPVSAAILSVVEEMARHGPGAFESHKSNFVVTTTDHLASSNAAWCTICASMHRLHGITDVDHVTYLNVAASLTRHDVVHAARRALVADGRCTVNRTIGHRG